MALGVKTEYEHEVKPTQKKRVAKLSEKLDTCKIRSALIMKENSSADSGYSHDESHLSQNLIRTKCEENRIYNNLPAANVAFYHPLMIAPLPYFYHVNYIPVE